jgi:hypothetical protein
MSHQLDFFQTSVEVTRLPNPVCPKRKPRSGSSGPPSQSGLSAEKHLIAPDHQAPRGDFFRELFETRRDLALAAQSDLHTYEDQRAELYWRLHWNPIFEGRRKFKGPVDQLQRKVGRNRCAEFDAWLRRTGAKGSSTAVRYRRLLATVERELRSIAASFQYLRTNSSCLSVTPTRWAEAQLVKARADVGELRLLFSDVAVLYRQLRKARLESVCR